VVAVAECGELVYGIVERRPKHDFGVRAVAMWGRAGSERECVVEVGVGVIGGGRGDGGTPTSHIDRCVVVIAGVRCGWRRGPSVPAA
jgi:hypothetical protein